MKKFVLCGVGLAILSLAGCCSNRGCCGGGGGFGPAAYNAPYQSAMTASAYPMTYGAPMTASAAAPCPCAR